MAPAAALPKNSPFPPQQPSSIQRISSKSDSNALFKTLIVIVLVLAIPLFPSQAPEFITQTVFNDFWEIIHLLFIGIAVSYGLFGRRTPQISADKFADSIADDSRSYLSGISHITSIFDDRYENVCYEHDVVQNYVDFGNQFLEKDESVAHSGRKIRSFAPNDGNERVCEGNVNVNRAWRSRYSKCESLVVVSNAECFNGGSSEFKPLNLPVRSLRSTAMDNDNNEQELKNRNEFTSSKFGANGNGNVEVVKIRGVAPVNLDKKFEEVAERSTIPWRSRFVRMGDEEEEEEEMSDFKVASHSRPHSVGEFEFEQIKSRSLGGSKFSSTPELRSSKVENLERKRFSSAPLDSEASSSSILSSSDMDSIGELENNVEESGVEDEVRKGKQALETDSKSPSLARVLPRAKSVRTIKPRRYVVSEKDLCPSRGDGRSGRRFIKSEPDFLVDKREEELEIIPAVEHEKQESGRIFSMPKPKPNLPEFHNEETLTLEVGEQLHCGKMKDREKGLGKSSDEEDTRGNMENDSELGSEVDRKAGEFIAKFREQIRRQKASSSVTRSYTGGGHAGKVGELLPHNSGSNIRVSRSPIVCAGVDRRCKK